MIPLDHLDVTCKGDVRRIELYQGDLTNLTPADRVNLLILSAFPNDYVPTGSSLIGALSHKGVSVYELAQDKAVDLRQTCSCWLSNKISAENPGIQFDRILCFEPLTRGSPPDVVGDIFRALTPFKQLGQRVFIDKQPIEKGAAWPQRVFGAIEDCHRIVSIYSQAYVNSKVCQDEFNVAFSRRYEQDEEVIFPIYWESAELAPHMKLLNYVDCREAQTHRLPEACNTLLGYLGR